VANRRHLAVLRKGVSVWNEWRREHPYIVPELDGTNLRRADLTKVDLTVADLAHADLSGARLRRPDLREARLFASDLSGADLFAANLQEADLRDANFRGADLRRADFSGADARSADLQAARLQRADFQHTDLAAADLRRANLSEANLASSTLVKTNLEGANLTGCRVYGASVWAVKLDGAVQPDLIITPYVESDITVDNIEVAQFIYLLLNNQKIRHVIDTITSKVVLILGRFRPERKPILDAMRGELRRRDYLPVLFDFAKPTSRDLTETISTLAHMARFVIADVTDARSIPQELMKIVPALPSVPVQPLLLASQQEYGMFEHFRRFAWVLVPVLYEDKAKLLADLDTRVIAPREAKANELRGK
jgi:hypothetical protein